MRPLLIFISYLTLSGGGDTIDGAGESVGGGGGDTVDSGGVGVVEYSLPHVVAKLSAREASLRGDLAGGGGYYMVDGRGVDVGYASPPNVVANLLGVPER